MPKIELEIKTQLEKDIKEAFEVNSRLLATIQRLSG